MGSLAACLVLVATAPAHPAVAYAAARQGIAVITQWLLVPSLALVLISGLLAIAANKAYHNAAWAWVKALLGISLFEGTLLTVGAAARDPGELPAALHSEWGTLWLLLAVAVTNIVLAVWRPRLFRRPPQSVDQSTAPRA